MIAVAPIAPLLRPFGLLTEPVAPSLTLVDHQNNSGATATVAGAAPRSTNDIYVQSFAGELGSDAWQLGGQVDDNGSVVLTLPTGHYFGYVASRLGGSTAVSAVSYFVVTDGFESLHLRCLAAVQARLRSLALDGLSSGNVLIKKLPLDRGLAGSALPAIILTPHRAVAPPTAGTNNLDDVTYDVLVAILDRDNQEPTLQANLDRQFSWREQISRAFRNQRLQGVQEIINASVEPAEELLLDAWKHELLASALLLRFTSRETRGI